MPQQEQVLLGVLVNGVDTLGADKAAVLRVRAPEASGSAPDVSLHKVPLYIVIHSSEPCANNSLENDDGICIHYKQEHNHSVLR